MKKIISLSLLSILITFIGYEKAGSISNKNLGKKKSSYVVLSIDGTEYGRFGVKDDVILVNEGRGKTAAMIGFGAYGFDISLNDGDMTATSGTILILYLKKANDTGHYSFDGLTISGYDGNGTKLNYRTSAGDAGFFYYSTDEKINRTKISSTTCNKQGSGIKGQTEVVVTRCTRNATNTTGLLEGNFTATLFGNSVKNVDDCVSDKALKITGYFYVNN